jgi:hypothetical protein
LHWPVNASRKFNYKKVNRPPKNFQNLSSPPLLTIFFLISISNRYNHIPYNFKMLAKAFIASTLLTAALASNIYARQDDASLSSLLASASAAASSASAEFAGCTPDAAVLSLLGTVPTPAADLVSAIEAQAQTDPCHLTFTGTVESEYKSYTGAILAWSKSNSAVLQSYESSLSANCHALTASTTVTGGVGICTTGSGATATAGGATTGKGATATGGSAASATASMGAAAPQNTFVAAAGAAIAGAIGVLAAL